jgi:hypothetical protein
LLLLSLVKEERCSEGEISVGSVQVAFSLLSVLVSRSNSFDDLLSTYCCRIEASKASKLGDQSVVVGCSFRHYRWMTLQLKMRVLLGLV